MKFSVCALSACLLSSGYSVTAFAPSSKSAPASELSVARNPNLAKVAGGYLFPEIGRRRSQYVEANPDMASRIVSLGIGDTYCVEYEYNSDFKVIRSTVVLGST